MTKSGTTESFSQKVRAKIRTRIGSYFLVLVIGILTIAISSFSPDVLPFKDFIRVLGVAFTGVALSNIFSIYLSEDPEDRLERAIAASQFNLTGAQGFKEDEKKLVFHFYKTEDREGIPFWNLAVHQWSEIPGKLILYSRTEIQDGKKGIKSYDCFLLKLKRAYVLIIYDEENDSEITAVNTFPLGAEPNTLHGVITHTTWANKIMLHPAILCRQSLVTKTDSGPLLDDAVKEVEQEWKAGMKSQLEGISSLAQDTKNAEQMDN